MAGPITAQDFPDIRWNGHYIWVEPAPPPVMFAELRGDKEPRPEVRALFRKTFELAEVPARVPARITVDSRYLLFANGQEVFQGPIRSQPRRKVYDLFDLAPYLHAGANTLAVYVAYYGTPRSYWMPAVSGSPVGRRGTLVFEADLGAAGWLVSDASWKCHKSDAWQYGWAGDDAISIFNTIPLEVYDARKGAPGWEQPGFDDSGWDNASVISTGGFGETPRSQPPTDPYGPLYPRPIARLGGDVRSPMTARVETLDGSVDSSIGDPVKRVEATLDLQVAETHDSAVIPLKVDLRGHGDARISFDMGGIVMGRVSFAVTAPAGAVFDFSYTEDPLKKAAGPFAMGMHAGNRYVARGHDDSFTLFDALGFRFAYVYIHGAHEEVSLDKFVVREDVYPWQLGASFTCSDDALNRIYQAGIRTVQLNARDAFTDCPTREQRAWVGDSVVHQMVSLATNTDWRLAWQYLNLGNSPRYDGILPMSVAGEIEASGGLTIPDWSLHWVHGVYNLYRFAGDRDKVKEYMPTVERVLRWYVPFQNRDGLLQDLVEWNLVDWAAISNTGASCIITGLWARGLQEFAEMAAWLGERASKAWADGLHAKAKAGFGAFWDAKRGSYVDHLVDGKQRPEMSQLGGAAAITGGLAPRRRWGRIIDAITDMDKVLVKTWMGSEPGQFSRTPDWDLKRQIISAEPFMSYLVHDAVAMAGRADILPDLYTRWAAFLADGYDTIGEDWQHGTHVHGWSCTPTKDMAFYTLGVTPAEPGYTAARIAPRLGRLTYAGGDVPTPHGLIRVWATKAGVTVNSPVPVIVELPGQAAVELPAGRHEVKG